MPVVFEWDEAKRVTNIAKHGIEAGEDRQRAIGIVQGVHVAVVFTLRGSAIRIISARRARHGEREQHQALHP